MTSGRDLPEWLRELTPEEPAASWSLGEAGAPERGLLPAEPPAPAQPPAPRGRRRRPTPAGLRAWQRFILALFLFLDVAVIGLLFLTMLGRIVIP